MKDYLPKNVLEVYQREFRSLSAVFRNSRRVLLFAHRRPDPDTIGSTVALKRYLQDSGKIVDIACFDPFPAYAKTLFQERFLHPTKIDFSLYDVFVGCDSVERGFHEVQDRIHPEKQVVVILDHHHDVRLSGDIVINDDDHFSSTAEILYTFFRFEGVRISHRLATPLLFGIAGDTGNFQHRCTSSQTLQAVSELLKAGAPLKEITKVVASNKNVALLHLWGKALEKARFHAQTGMIYAALSEEDLKEYRDILSSEDIKKVSSFLATVPYARFSLFAFQEDPETIRCSLRSEKEGIDVSHIAQSFGGGGHALAAGFIVKGRIVPTPEGWTVQ